MNQWEHQQIAKYIKQYGAVPPPWIAFPDSHPYSMRWRMGDGEEFKELWGKWWERQGYDEAQRLAYFRQWSPSGCWLEWMIDAIWDIRPWEHPEGFDYTPYFARIESLGFGSQADFERDLNDPKWLEN